MKLDNLKLAGPFDYCSTQFNMDDKTKKEIQSFIKEILNEEELKLYGIEEDSHVTVKYGILFDEAVDTIINIVKDNHIKPFDIYLGKTSVFKHDKFDIVKIDIISPQLRKLNSLISKAVPNEDTYPVYKPHVTLFYCTKDAGNKYSGSNRFLGKKVMCKDLVFSNKDNEVQIIKLEDK